MPSSILAAFYLVFAGKSGALEKSGVSLPGRSENPNTRWCVRLVAGFRGMMSRRFSSTAAYAKHRSVITPLAISVGQNQTRRCDNQRVS
jgi:hypothetical protein